MRAEFAAVFALLDAVPNMPVFKDDDVPEKLSDRPALYVVLYDQTPLLGDIRLSSGRGSAASTYAVLHVGTSSGEVRWAVERSSAALERKRPTAGATPLKKIGNSQVRPDLDTHSPRLYSATDVWRFAATKTA